MLLSLLHIKILEEYRSDRNNLIEDFYLPCLEHSTLYCRAVGFFSSSSIVAVSQGLSALIRLGGKMRLIASPHLSKEDVEAINLGLSQKEAVITQSLLKTLEQEFAEIVQDQLACLAWLLGQGILEIKLAIPRNLTSFGIYHEKLGIFKDSQENIIAFTGSANESYSSLVEHFECIDVFCSWKLEEQQRAKRKDQHFQQLWNNKTPNVEILEFPEAAARSLLRFRLFSPPYTIRAHAMRPYTFSSSPKEPINSLQAHNVRLYTLKPRQEEALAAWKQANYRGILAMATGAGKTLTALSGVTQLDLDLIIIGATTKEIVQQWVKEIHSRTNFPFPVVAIGKSSVWRKSFFRKLRLIHHQVLPRLPVIIVGTYSELSKSPIHQLIEDAGGMPKKSLLIADEVHATGAGTYQRILNSDFTYRLGLSATPIRAYDEEGTEVVLDYFGGIVYEFSLEEAIKAGILCQYDYYVYVTALNEEEYQCFQELTQKIRRLLSSKNQETGSYTQQLLIQRSRLIKSAQTKIEIIDRIITDRPPHQALIYCADIAQATQVSQKLAQKGFRIARYTSVDSNRQQMLVQLALGHLDALVAVKCLDEGVDIPVVSQGIILASDASERQFIQRRGRILRAAHNKEIATLVDILVVPPCGDEQVKLIESEIRRVILFARCARNRTSVITKLVKELGHYGITYSDLI